MKRNYKILLALVLLSVTLFAFKMKSSNEADPDKDKLLLELLTFVIERALQPCRNWWYILKGNL
jgi:carboxyl-terminal processing protease